MALSDITRKTLRSDVRARLGKPGTDEIHDAEINQWLDMGQFDIANRLCSISDQWYGDNSHTNVYLDGYTAGVITERALPSGATAADIIRIKAVMGKKRTGGGASTIPYNGRLIPWARLEELYSMTDNSLYSGHWAVTHFGEKLYFFFGSSVSMTSGEAVLYFLKKPAEMTADTSVVNVPSEFADLVVMFAHAKALGKLGMSGQRQEVEGEMVRRFDEIRSTYANEIQLMQLEKQPGTQTPRFAK